MGVRCWFAALLLGQYLAVGEECDEASGTCAANMPRTVVDKTPTPCLKTYDDALVKAAAAKHIAGPSTDNKVPHLLVLLGGSGAGKGTFMKHLKKNGVNVDDFVMHGLDEYLIYMPEYQKTIGDTQNIYKDAADDCYGGAIAIAKTAQTDMIARRQNVMYEETGKNLDRILKRVLPPFEGAGYRITIVLVDNSAEIAKIRAAERFQKEGRYAPDDYIDGTFKSVPENFKALKETGRVQEAAYCDNSCLEGGAVAVEDAQKKKGCLRCWRDDVLAPATPAKAEMLITPSALLDGTARRLNAAAR